MTEPLKLCEFCEKRPAWPATGLYCSVECASDAARALKAERGTVENEQTFKARIPYEWEKQAANALLAVHCGELLAYVQHHKECIEDTDNDECTCGLTELCEAVEAITG